MVIESLGLANVLKLNETELPILAEMLRLRGTDDALLQQLVKRFSLKLVALTRGAPGAVLLSASGERSDLPAPATAVVDTVGAGDSFTAALVIGLFGGLPLSTINAWGNRVAAFVSSQSAQHLICLSRCVSRRSRCIRESLFLSRLSCRVAGEVAGGWHMVGRAIR